MTDNQSSRIFAAVFLSIVVATLSAGASYLLLVVASFFVAMPSAARSGVIVGGLLAVIFAATFAVALSKMLDKKSPSHRQ